MGNNTLLQKTYLYDLVFAGRVGTAEQEQLGATFVPQLEDSRPVGRRGRQRSQCQLTHLEIKRCTGLNMYRARHRSRYLGH